MQFSSGWRRRAWRLGLSLGLAWASGCSSSGGADAGSDGGPVPQRPGASCDAGFQCDTGSCLGNHCCAGSCVQDPAAPECSACDANGACSYPAVACGAASCDPASSKATAVGVCQQGACQAGAAADCAPYGCAGEVCASGCAFDQDCALGYRCAVPVGADGGPGSCQPKDNGGSYCAHADECASQLCLHNVCCSQQCLLDPQHLECTTCDSVGACQYPAAVCQQSGCDSAANAFRSTAACAGAVALLDAGSACPAAATRACGEYQCQAAGCGTQCLASTDCIAGAFCLVIGGVGSCCPPFAVGAPVYVDILSGSDEGCCGATPDHPCQTMKNAMSLVQYAQRTGQAPGLTSFTLNLTVDGSGGDWITDPASSPKNEVWPLQLADGVTLHGPGVFVSTVQIPPPGPGVADRYRVSLEGDPGNPMYLGVTHNAQLWIAPGLYGTAVLAYQTAPSTLNLANAVVWGLLSDGVVNVGIDSQRRYGPVQIGAFSINGSATAPPSLGLQMSSAGLLTDYGLGNQTALVVENIAFINPGDNSINPSPGLFLYNASASLTHHPQIGRALVADGGAVVPGAFKYSGTYGIEVGQNAKLDLENARVEGWSIDGILVDSAASVPFGDVADAGDNALRVINSVIDQNGCNGLEVLNGTAAVSGTDFAYNFTGATQDAFNANAGFTGEAPALFPGSLDLSHGADGGASSGNRVFCNRPIWKSAACRRTDQLGIGVQNQSALPLAADGLSWESSPPQLWTCQPQLGSSDCTAGATIYAGQPLEAVTDPDALGHLGAVTLTRPGPAVSVVCP